MKAKHISQNLAVALFLIPIVNAEPKAGDEAKSLDIKSIQILSETRNAMRARLYPADSWTKVIQAEDLANAVRHQMAPMLPEIRTSLEKNSGDCALVEVVVDSSPRPDGTKTYILRGINNLGVGDSAVQVLGARMLRGSIGEGPKDGFKHDTEASMLLCFGISDNELKVNPIAMINVEPQILAAAKLIRDQEIKRLVDASKKKTQSPPKKKNKSNATPDHDLRPDTHGLHNLRSQSEPRAPEPRVSEPRVSEPRVSEPRVSEPRVSEPIEIMPVPTRH